MYDSMRRSRSRIFQKLSSEIIDASVSWCKVQQLTMEHLHAVIHYTAMKTVDTFKLKLSCSVTNTSWSEWSSVFASGEHCLRFKHSAAFVSNTLLHSLRTHYCVPSEHTTAFDSIRNERSAFTSKRRRTHQDVNTNAGFVLFKRSCVFSFVFNCSNWNAFALRWQVFAGAVTYTGSGSI